jgi:hypothetical protein
VWVFNFDEEAAILQIILSAFALVIFGSKIELTIIAYGPSRYCRSWVCVMEIGIVILDSGAIVSSVTTLQSPSREEAILYFSFFQPSSFYTGFASFTSSMPRPGHQTCRGGIDERCKSQQDPSHYWRSGVKALFGNELRSDGLGSRRSRTCRQSFLSSSSAQGRPKKHPKIGTGKPFGACRMS